MADISLTDEQLVRVHKTDDPNRLRVAVGGPEVPLISMARRLAAEIEARHGPAVIAERLVKWAKGIDPDAPPGAGHAPVPVEIRWRAECTLIERSVGKPKSHVVLEGTVQQDVRAAVMHAHAHVGVSDSVAREAIDPRDLRAALGPELETYRQLETRVLEAARAKLARLVRDHDRLLESKPVGRG